MWHKHVHKWRLRLRWEFSWRLAKPWSFDVVKPILMNQVSMPSISKLNAVATLLGLLANG